jgi:predicted TIM-barrel fold metal-dependent hydrolase
MKLTSESESNNQQIMSINRRHNFPVFDADHHLYETKEAFTRHLPEAYKHVIQYVEVNGRTKIVVRGQISDYIPNPTFDVIARPGAHEEFYKNGNPKGLSMRELTGKAIKCPPAFREPESRLKDMDEQGVDRALMFPTLASLLEERLRDDPDAIHVVGHSLNEWLHETWSFNYKNRIFTAPLISLPVVDKAVKELEWVLERGAKTILVRPAPVPGYRHSRSFAYPEFDPFWKLVEQSGVVVSMHSADSGYARYQGDWTGPSEMLPFKFDAFRMMSMLKRPIEDSCAALVCHGVLTRFPKLKIAMIENGGSWVPHFLEQLKDVYKKMPQAFEENPIEAFRRNIYVSPFFEDKLTDLIECIGADHMLFGSDYPHPEGLADPCKYVEHLPSGLSDAQVRDIMGGTLGKLIGINELA